MADEVGGLSARVELDDSGLDAQLTKLKASLNAVEAKLRETGAVGGVASQKFGELAARKADLRVQIDQVTAAMKQQAAASHQLVAGMGGIGAATKKSQYQFQVFVQGLDDLQYVPEMGLRPILNNIIQFSPALGFAALGVQGLITAFGGLEGISKTLFGESKTLTEAEEMDKLAKNTKRTADETARLNELKLADKTWTDIAESKSKAEKKIEADLQEVITEGPGRDIEKSLSEVMGNRAKMTPEDTEKLKQARMIDATIKAGNVGQTAVNPVAMIFQAWHGTAEEQTKTINERLAKENLKIAKDLIKDAIHGIGVVGENARKQFLNIVEANPGAFPEGLGKSLRAQTPEGINASETIRLTLEGEAGAAAYDKKLKKDRNDAIGIEAQHDAEEKAMAQARRDEQDKKDTDALIAEGDRNASKLDVAERIKPFLPGAPLSVKAAIAQSKEQDSLDERMRQIGRRMAGMNARDIRTSQVMATSDLNASIQRSISNDDPARRMLEETKEMNREIKEINRKILNLGQPVVRGGRN